MHPLPVCPMCQQTDQIQKVTSLYAANTKEWKETSTGLDSWGNTVTTEHLRQAHTTLGLKLKLPDAPAGPTHPGLWYGIGGLVVFVFGSVFCTAGVAPLIFLLPLLGGVAFLPDLAGMPAWAVTALGVGLPVLCLGGLGLGLLLWGGKKIKTRFDRDMKNYHTQKAIFERDELPRWQRAKARWEQLFYCLRDETLFIPGENRAIRVEDMENYLHNPYYKS